MLTEDLRGRLAAHADYLTLGVDTKNPASATTFRGFANPHAELVGLVDLRSASLHWTGKFYPLDQQQETLVRFPDLGSHFVRLNGEPMMILGCHDLSAYNPRTEALVRGWKQRVRTEFRQLARQHQPVGVLHHPHSTTKCSTWKAKWSSLLNELPSVRDYLGTGAYSLKDPRWNDRDGLADVLRDTERGEVLNAVVRLGA